MDSNIALRVDKHGRKLNPFILSAQEFAIELQKYSNWFTGVPDSMFRKLFTYLSPYTPAPRENHGVSMAFGARLAGKKPCILMQNSGLGLCGDVIYGLVHLYKVGLLFIVTLRGELDWEEKQHHMWGKNTVEFLKILDIIPYDLQESGINTIKLAAEAVFVENKPAAIIIHRGNIDE